MTTAVPRFGIVESKCGHLPHGEFGYLPVKYRNRAARGNAIDDLWRHVRWTKFPATLGDGQAADAWMRRAKLNAYRLLPPLPLP